MSPAERQRRLAEIYAEIPDVPCKRLCSDSCSFIGTFRAERERMQAAGVTPPRMDQAPCPLLMFNGECGAHEWRPVICRLYGATEELECPFGCKSERQLTKAEAYEIFLAVDRLLPFPSQGDTTLPNGHKHPLAELGAKR
jgi:Fe-S-cluster containining protein